MVFVYLVSPQINPTGLQQVFPNSSAMMSANVCACVHAGTYIASCEHLKSTSHLNSFCLSQEYKADNQFDATQQGDVMMTKTVFDLPTFPITYNILRVLFEMDGYWLPYMFVTLYEIYLA